MLDAEELIKELKLEKHPKEGGYFRETYRSEGLIARKHLPSNYNGARNFTTAIYYLLTPDTFSAIHRISSDEVFHFYYGDTVEMIQLFEDGRANEIIIGSDISSGESPQVVVPKNVWQGSRLKKGGKLALLGCTVSPGFDYEDYQHGDRQELLNQYPQAKEWINALTNQ